MFKGESGIVFSVVCNRSRRREFGRVAGQIGVELFPDSQPVFRSLSEKDRQIVGQLMGGRVDSVELLNQLQQEVDRRGLAISPIQRVSEGNIEIFQMVLSNRNQTIWFGRR